MTERAPLILSGLLIAPTSAAVLAGEAAAVSCYESPQYFVIARERPSDIGTDVLVRYKPSPESQLPCEYQVGTKDFEIRKEHAEYYLGLEDDFLVLDSRTGNVRFLIVWDLRKREKVYSGQYNEPVEIKAGRIEFWEANGPARDSDCPEKRKYEADFFTVVTETWTTLDLATLSKTHHPETRCVPRE